MASAVCIPISEYLATTYRPDREFVDGKVVEKNIASWEHSRIQALLTILFGNREEQWGVVVATEWRTRVNHDRGRLPDVLLVPKGPVCSIRLPCWSSNPVAR